MRISAQTEMMPRLEDALEQCFPDIGSDFAAIVRSIESMRLDDAVPDDALTVLRKVGNSHAGLDRLTKLLSDGTCLAMEYLGPITSFMPFDPTLCKDTVAGPGMDVVVITDVEGTPCGLIPLEEHSGRFSAFSGLKDSGCIAVTDSVSYSDENIRALEKSGCDYILRQRQFPPSYGPNSRQKMLPLKHEGRDYSACKCRFDKKWLYMFYNQDNAESVRAAVQCMNIRSQDSDFLVKSAGYENAISETGHDIREVRNLLDIRIRTDRLMQSCRIAISSDDRLMHDREAMVGFILAFILCRRPEFR